MPRRNAAMGLLAALALAGCEGAVAPDRGPAYDFVAPGTDQVFRWPQDRLPVRYWVAPDAGVVRGFAAQGIARWTAQFLYGEFRGEVVDDSARADVLVFVEPASPPTGQPNDDPPALGACRGITSGTVSTAPYRLLEPFRVRVLWDDQYTDAEVVNCLDRVVTHELGHTIGIFGHSPNDADLMSASPRVNTPSEGDRTTVETLYHTPRNVDPPERPR